MKNIAIKRMHYILIYLVFICFSCNTEKKRFEIEELSEPINDTVPALKKYSFKKSYGHHFSYSTSSKPANTNDKLQNVTFYFKNKKLSSILDQLKYPYNANNLRKNPILNIDYFKQNTTKEKAVKEIVSHLKETYDF